MARRPRICGYIELTIKLQQDPEQGVWDAVCLELGTATFGDTIEQATQEIGEMITLHLNGLEVVGERRRFFREHGIRFHRVKPTRQSKQVRVPFEDDVFVKPVIQPVLAPA